VLKVFKNHVIFSDKELSINEMYETIKKKSSETKNLYFQNFQDCFNELYDSLRKADVLLLKGKNVTIKYPWEDLLK
jgi:hypothetical protein